MSRRCDREGVRCRRPVEGAMRSDGSYVRLPAIFDPLALRARVLSGDEGDPRGVTKIGAGYVARHLREPVALPSDDGARS